MAKLDPYKKPLQIRYRPIDQIRPATTNPRTHSDTQIAQLARSIQDYGWTNPILLDENNIVIAGHGRLLAAGSLGLVEVPCITLAGLSVAQTAALVIADNQLALNAGWNNELLRAELAALQALDFDLTGLGFSATELDQLMAPDIDPAGEWQGMPEFEQPAKKAFQSITVHMKDQAAVDSFARLIGQPVSNRTKFAWFPQIEIERYADKRYVEDEPAISNLHSLERTLG